LYSILYVGTNGFLYFLFIAKANEEQEKTKSKIKTTRKRSMIQRYSNPLISISNRKRSDMLITRYR